MEDEKIFDIQETEDDVSNEIKKKGKVSKAKVLKIILGITAGIFVLSVGIYLLLTSQTYENVEVLEVKAVKELENGTVLRFGDALLKYNKDGIVLIDQVGREFWNYSIQFKNPEAVINGKSIVVADKLGTGIAVFEEKGLRGQFNTHLPIEKVVVSSQGIVGVILKSTEAPQLACYDAVGNLLIENKVSTARTGYPIDISISPDGYKLLVSYLYIENGRASAKVIHYDFREENAEKRYLVAEKTYENEIISKTAFLENDISVAIGNQTLVIYEDIHEPKEKKRITLGKTIKSAFVENGTIGLILKNKDNNISELRLYDINGEIITTMEFEGDYTNASVFRNQVVLYDKNRCLIFMRKGIKRYEGELSEEILQIFPIIGFNKYAVIVPGGTQEIRLVK